MLLEELGIAAAALHSHKPQRARLAALDRFKGGAVPVLLATDVAARGLDIPTVDLVINYDLPMLARDYVHRWAAGPWVPCCACRGNGRLRCPSPAPPTPARAGLRLRCCH